MKGIRTWMMTAVAVGFLCQLAWAAVDLSQFLTAGGAVDQAAVVAAIQGGADPIQLAVDLAKAKPEMADAFAVAVATASPDVDIATLAKAVITAVPNQAQKVFDTLMAAFPNSTSDLLAAITGIAGIPAAQLAAIQASAASFLQQNSFQTLNQLTGTDNNLTNQESEAKRYQNRQQNQEQSPFRPPAPPSPSS